MLNICIKNFSLITKFVKWHILDNVSFERLLRQKHRLQ